MLLQNNQKVFPQRQPILNYQRIISNLSEGTTADPFQVLPGNWKNKNISKLFLWSWHHTDTKKQRCHKNENSRPNIPDEHRHLNPQKHP